MINKLYFLCIIFLSLCTLSFQWPVKNPSLTSAFGESREDHLHDGVDVSSQYSQVNPIENGKLLFFWNKALFPFDPYSGSGNFVILDHGDKYCSYYLHLDLNTDYKQSYNKDDLVGNFADTGRSYGQHVHLGIIEKSDWSTVNPLKTMPEFSDIEPPVIGNMGFMIGDKIMQLQDKSKVRLTTPRPLLVNIFDTAKKNGVRFGIYRLQAKANGRLVCDIIFEKIKLTKNGTAVNNKVFSDLYEGKDFYKLSGIDYRPGINNFEITASDFFGNTTTKNYSLDVFLDYGSGVK